MKIASRVCNAVKNECKIFANSRRAGQLAVAYSGKKLAYPVMQAKYFKKQVGIIPVVGFTAGAVSPIPGASVAGYIIGRIASSFGTIAKKFIK